ncbi:hypothetical protein N7520_005201 [Penicillium odoratum]|uniref:uncharacterized protein n=1 Tax=Penicillium odoratum TaxID=1167516 RepID=UPI002548359F|nr:uncharacterized protein N7520_005201 [Penicillium odoratum]KAJ5765642.1 hypothetical protein N7520_005201 [Penicillium odoratum]
MTNGYNWCPTNIYELHVILLDDTDDIVDTLQIEENGNLFGKWNIVSLDLIENERFISGDSHPLIEAKVSLAREKKNEHMILIEPGLTSQRTGVNRGLLVKPSIMGDKT